LSETTQIPLPKLGEGFVLTREVGKNSDGNPYITFRPRMPGQKQLLYITGYVRRNTFIVESIGPWGFEKKIEAVKLIRLFAPSITQDLARLGIREAKGPTHPKMARILKKALPELRTTKKSEILDRILRWIRTGDARKQREATIFAKIRLRVRK